MFKIKAVIECDEARCSERAEVLVDQDYEIYHLPNGWVDIVEVNNDVRHRKHYCPEHTKGW